MNTMNSSIQAQTKDICYRWGYLAGMSDAQDKSPYDEHTDAPMRYPDQFAKGYRAGYYGQIDPISDAPILIVAILIVLFVATITYTVFS